MVHKHRYLPKGTQTVVHTCTNSGNKSNKTRIVLLTPTLRRARIRGWTVDTTIFPMQPWTMYKSCYMRSCVATRLLVRDGCTLLRPTWVTSNFCRSCTLSITSPRTQTPRPPTVNIAANITLNAYNNKYVLYSRISVWDVLSDRTMYPLVIGPVVHSYGNLTSRGAYGPGAYGPAAYGPAVQKLTIVNQDSITVQPGDWSYFRVERDVMQVKCLTQGHK